MEFLIGVVIGVGATLAFQRWALPWINDRIKVDI